MQQQIHNVSLQCMRNAYDYLPKIYVKLADIAICYIIYKCMDLRVPIPIRDRIGMSAGKKYNPFKLWKVSRHT